MLHFNDDSLRTRLPPDRQAQPYRANIIYQGRPVFAICIRKIEFKLFFSACQQLLLSQVGMTGVISLWCLRTTSGPGPVISKPYKVYSDAALRHVFSDGTESGETIVRNFEVVCKQNKPKQGQDAKTQNALAHSKPKKLKQGDERGFRLLQLQAGRSRTLQSQLRLLNKAFKTLPPSTVAGKRERRRRQFAAMLVTMRKRPQRASMWLRKMQRQHCGNTRMLRILSILHIFVNNLLHGVNKTRVC